MSRTLKSQKDWRHLYRALLRECTYLPDPIANQYMRDYIRLSFRQNSSKYGSGPIPQPKLNIVRRRAKTYLSVLSRANEGYLKPLDRILFLSYGRIGRRKHILLQPLLTPDDPESNTLPSSADWKTPSRLLALAKSQAQQEVAKDLQSKLSVKPYLSIPEKNTWGRPMPLRRQRNMRNNWYNNLINDVLPPLPEAEWKILCALATGKISWEPPKRRKSQPKPEQPYLDANFLARGPKKGFTFARYAKGRPHNLKPRLMQRLWRRICSLTPHSAQSSRPGDWKFQWDVPQQAPRLAYYKPGSVSGLGLFEGVNPKSGKKLV